jgi:hypothetical protein
MTTTLPSGPQLAPKDVAAAAQEYWRVAGEIAEVVDWDVVANSLGLAHGAAISAAVLIPKIMQIECVLDTDTELTDAWADLSALVSQGWRVQALLPLPALGAAHEALRGLDILLQGWWIAQGRGLRFTSPETP